MISALITPGHHAFLGLRKAHAKFAQAGTFSFDVGMVLTLPALLSLPASRQGVRMVSVILVLVPLTSYLLSRILLPSLADPDSLNRTTHPPLLGSLAFWEWTGSATVFLYTGIIVLALKPKFALHPGPNKTGF
jgi:hypothetical protein